MIEHIVANLHAAYYAVAGIFVGVALLMDRRQRRRWEPVEIDRGEIVTEEARR